MKVLYRTARYSAAARLAEMTQPPVLCFTVEICSSQGCRAHIEVAYRTTQCFLGGELAGTAQYERTRKE